MQLAIQPKLQAVHAKLDAFVSFSTFQPPTIAGISTTPSKLPSLPTDRMEEFGKMEKILEASDEQFNMQSLVGRHNLVI